MNRRASAQIFFQEKSELFLNAAANSNNNMCRRVTFNLRDELLIANFAGITRRDVEIGAARKINFSQPGDCFFVRMFAWDDPENALVRMRRESRNEAVQKFQARD